LGPSQKTLHLGVPSWLRAWLYVRMKPIILKIVQRNIHTDFITFKSLRNNFRSIWSIKRSVCC